MIPAIIIGRGGSKGFPGKNSYKVRGHPMMAYPIMAANNSTEVHQVWFSTDSHELKRICFDYRCRSINRPPELATDEALGEDVFVHAYEFIKDRERDLQREIEMVVLMFANAPCIVPYMIDGMINMLRATPSADSMCTISKYNMFSPYRMRYTNGGSVINFMRQDELIGNCDRDSAGNFYIYDCSCAVVRPKCLEDIEYGFLPQKWLGRSVLGWSQITPALDVDYEWQLGQVEYWLDKHYG